MNPCKKDSSTFHGKFMIGNFIGDGNFSVVKECFERTSLTKYAVKVARLKGTGDEREDLREMMTSEVAVMRALEHPNVIKCIDAFFGSSEILIVLEYAAVSDMFFFKLDTIYFNTIQ